MEKKRSTSSLNDIHETQTTSYSINTEVDNEDSTTTKQQIFECTPHSIHSENTKITPVLITKNFIKKRKKESQLIKMIDTNQHQHLVSTAEYTSDQSDHSVISRYPVSQCVSPKVVGNKRPDSYSDQSYSDASGEELPEDDSLGGLADTQNVHVTEKDVHQTFELNPPMRKRELPKAFFHHVKDNYLTNNLWWNQLFLRSVPFIQTIKSYKKEYILPDIAAGLAAGISAIPVGMSYASLARVPPENGLYCQLFFCIIYMFLGTGRQVCIGTSAIEAMMGAQIIADILGWDASTKDWLNASIGLSLFVGIELIIMRCLGLGIVANFLADPVVSGFSTGCAVTIGTSQLQYLFGIKVPRSTNPQTWWYLITHMNEINVACLVVGMAGIFLLATFQLLNKKWFSKFPLPGSFFVMIVFICVSSLIKIDGSPFYVPVIKNVPKGLPQPKVFDFDLSVTLPLLKSSFLYSLVYFFIHTSIARSVAQKGGYVIDCDQELLAVGTCSLVGSFFQCYPVATSVARTSIAYVAGAKTSLYNVPSFATIALTLTILMPVLYYLPMPTLASVVLFGVYFMFSFSEGWRLLKLFSPDFLLWAVCFFVTVFCGAMQGIIAGVILSLLWILKENAFPSTRTLGRLPGTTIYRNVKNFAEALEIEGIKILQFDASLNFSNSSHFEKKLLNLAGLAEESKKQNNHKNLDNIDKCWHPFTNIRVIIIDASSINRIDVTAIRMLEQVAERLERANKLMLFANWKSPTHQFLRRAKFYDTVPSEHCFLDIHSAVEWAENYFIKKNSETAIVVTPGSDVASTTTRRIKLKHDNFTSFY